jgi:hypothetical protein
MLMRTDLLKKTECNKPSTSIEENQQPEPPSPSPTRKGSAFQCPGRKRLFELE